MFYDLEIVSAIPNDPEPRDPGIYYCKGWDDYEGMGISVVGVYDFVESAYRVYLQDNLDSLRRLIESRSIVCGFVTRRFDNKVLRANAIEIPEEKSYDLWDAIVNTQPPGERKGFKLNNMLAANGVPLKSGDGGDAPKLAQRGEWGKLINYCLDDNRLGVYLLRLACNDVMKSPKTGSYLKVKKPWEHVTVEPGEGLF